MSKPKFERTRKALGTLQLCWIEVALSGVLIVVPPTASIAGPLMRAELQKMGVLDSETDDRTDTQPSETPTPLEQR